MITNIGMLGTSLKSQLPLRLFKVQLDPGIDAFMPSDDEDVDDDTFVQDLVDADAMADALLNAGANHGATKKFVSALYDAKEGLVGPGGKGSSREEDDHIGLCESNSRSDDAIAALALEPRTRPQPKSKGNRPTFIEVYGGGAICNQALRMRRSLNVEGLDALDLRTQKPDPTESKLAIESTS
mgnify:CR=1 FL=1